MINDPDNENVIPKKETKERRKASVALDTQQMFPILFVRECNGRKTGMKAGFKQTHTCHPLSHIRLCCLFVRFV